MHKQPVFRSQRLTLSPARQEHLPQLHSCWNEPEVRRFLFDDYEVSLAMAQGLLARCLAVQDQGLGMWLLNLRDENRFIGCAALYPVGLAAHYEPRLAGLLEPLIALHPNFWNGGYAREALRELLDYGFVTLDQPSIAAVNDAKNIASERLLLKSGFTLVCHTGGLEHPLCTYMQDAMHWIQVRNSL